MEPVEQNELKSSLNSSHVIILHEKLQCKTEDRYLVSLAAAFERNNHKVTIMTSYLNKNSCLADLELKLENIEVIESAWWIPQSFIGMFGNTLSLLKAAVMAFRVIFFPPPPEPVIVLLDLNPIAILLIKLFSKYSVFYVENFVILKDISLFAPCLCLTPGLFTARWLKQADEIIVSTECLADIFRRSFPRVKKDIHVFHQCVDIGLWRQECIDINRIIPDLPRNHIIFSVFGKYIKRSNFRLVVEAFENLLLILDHEHKHRIHLVFAGHAKTIEEKLFYHDIIESTKEKSFANQITFLRQLPVVHKKTIIRASAAVIHPTKHDITAGPILAAMNLGALVIATNTGTPAHIISHRLTGILVDGTPQQFAAAMNKVITRPALREFMKDMAGDLFKKVYSFENFSKKLKQLTVKYEMMHS